MSTTKNIKKSIVKRLFNRREHGRPEEEADVVRTLEEISRQVQKEAAESLMKQEEDFFAPTHVLKPGTVSGAVAKDEGPAGLKEKTVKRCRLTPDQYENIIENTLTVLEVACQIIDRNSAVSSRLKVNNMSNTIG